MYVIIAIHQNKTKNLFNQTKKKRKNKFSLLEIGKISHYFSSTCCLQSWAHIFFLSFFRSIFTVLLYFDRAFILSNLSFKTKQLNDMDQWVMSSGHCHCTEWMNEWKVQQSERDKKKTIKETLIYNQLDFFFFFWWKQK